MTFIPKAPLFLSRDQLAFQEGKAFSLIVDLISNTTELYVLRGFTKEGPFTFNIVPAGDLTAETFTFRIPDIPVMFTVIAPTAGTLSNQCHIAVSLGIDGSKNILLAQGQPTFLSGLTWPQQSPYSPIQLRGHVDQITGTNPAANTESSVSVPQRQWWKLIAYTISLVTDANAATRQVHLTFGGLNGYTGRLVATTTQTASLTRVYDFFIGVAGIIDAEAGRIQTALPADLLLPPGSSIETVTTARQATDNYGAPTLWIERFFAT